MCSHEDRIRPAFPQHQMQHAVVQHHVGAGLDLQKQVGLRCGVGAPGVHHHQFQRRVGAAGILYASKQDRMRVGSVGTGDENGARMPDVVVTGRRRVHAQRLFVTCNGAAHAQA